jgi:hypothetical protein
MRKFVGIFGAALATATLAMFTAALAGPPYETDDPEPTDYRSYEIYTALQYEHEGDETSAGLPSLEINYGILRNTQLSIVTPMRFAHENGVNTYGFGDLLFGVKVRFIQEAAHRPQLAFYPIVIVPSGQAALRETASHVFLPMWAQKSFGNWTVYGGGGVWNKAGTDTHAWWFSGVVAQYHFKNKSAAGVEVTHTTAQKEGEENETSFNAGYIAPIGERHNVLFSFGRGLMGPRTFAAYAAYRIEISP